MGQSFFNKPSGFNNGENSRSNHPSHPEENPKPRFYNAPQEFERDRRDPQYGNQGYGQDPYAQDRRRSQYDPNSYAQNGNVQPYEEEEWDIEDELNSYRQDPYRNNDRAPEPLPVKKNNTLPIILICVLSFLLLAGAAFITIFLLKSDSCEKDEEKPVSETSERPTVSPEIEPQETTYDYVPVVADTSSPLVTLVPAPVVTQQPVITPPPTPSPEPTPTPTPSPTPLPDSFMFGGVRIQAGVREINGRPNAMNFNGDSNGNFTRITKEEVEMMVLLCPDLEVLDVDFCWFDTYEPLSKLKNLEYLELKTCGNSKGGVPLTDIGWIEDLTNLKHLNLCHNRIDDISPLEGLTDLEWLSLADNNLSDSDLSYLKGMSALKSLYLYSNNLKDVSVLKNLSNLETLNLGNNKKIKSVKNLTKLKKLSVLQLFGTAIDDLSYFKDFSRLSKVDLAGCKNLSYSDYYYDLPKCKKLKTFIVAKDDYDGIAAGETLKMEGSSLKYEIK